MTKKRAAPPKTTKAKMSNKAAEVSPSDEETAVETPKEPEKQVDPQEAKAKKQKESKKLYDTIYFFLPGFFGH
jgi:hypothetical protein